MIGSLPHFYYYSIGNVGEGIIAKRRTHAALISYLTPPFMESRTRGQFSDLFKEIDSWHNAPEERQPELSKKIKTIALNMGLHRDLQLDSISNQPFTAEEIERIENYAEEIANEKMTGRLYTSGQSFSPEEIESTVIAMCNWRVMLSSPATIWRRSRKSYIGCSPRHKQTQTICDKRSHPSAVPAL